MFIGSWNYFSTLATKSMETNNPETNRHKTRNKEQRSGWTRWFCRFFLLVGWLVGWLINHNNTSQVIQAVTFSSPIVGHFTSERVTSSLTIPKRSTQNCFRRWKIQTEHFFQTRWLFRFFPKDMIGSSLFGTITITHFLRHFCGIQRCYV